MGISNCCERDRNGLPTICLVPLHSGYPVHPQNMDPGFPTARMAHPHSGQMTSDLESSRALSARISDVNLPVADSA